MNEPAPLHEFTQYIRVAADAVLAQQGTLDKFMGEAVVGNIGTPQLMDYTAIGDSVNEVKRLQENAKGGQILISQETYYAVRDQIFAQEVGILHLKGQSHPEPVFEILSLNGH